MRKILKHKYKCGVKSKSQKPSTKTVKSQKPSPFRKSHKPSPFRKSQKNTNTSVFAITEDNEDEIESNLAVLIELMGSSLYNIYVDEVLNLQLTNMNKPNILIKQVTVPSSEKNLISTRKQNGCNPTIFYGFNAATTHFTCTVDCNELWDSYRHVQVNVSDHFCQTFALMKMINHFFPESDVGNEYTKLHQTINSESKYGILTPQQYIENAFFAKNAACSILQHLIDNPTLFTQNPQYYEDRPNEAKTINHYFLEILNLEGNKHLLNNKYTDKTLQKLITYCKNITLVDFKTENSFRKKITLEK